MQLEQFFFTFCKAATFFFRNWHSTGSVTVGTLRSGRYEGLQISTPNDSSYEVEACEVVRGKRSENKDAPKGG